MPPDTEKTIKRLAAHLFSFPLEKYLFSEDFFGFLQEYDLGDAWNEYLVFSQDRPDLYGDAVTKNAFGLFLHHIFHSRPGEFLPLFTCFIIGFSQAISQALPVDDLKKDLMVLGYSDEDIDNEFSNLKANVKDPYSA
jgi:hypothetical protein